MWKWRLSSVALIMALVWLPTGCHSRAIGVDDNTEQDAAVDSDAGPWVDGGVVDDGAMRQDGTGVDGYVPPCDEADFECRSDGTARWYVNGSWVELGPCPLGCDPAACACRVLSNVPADLVDDGTGDLTLRPNHSPVVINTDTGSIMASGSTVIRPADVLGLHAPSGISYAQIAQTGNPGLGVFSFANLSMQEGVVLTVVGQRALVILVSGHAAIDGVINVSASGFVGGPGGFDGGEPGQAGHGPCEGQAGVTGPHSGEGCTSGGGGGGHGGTGGNGGNSISPCGDFPGGSGGQNAGGVPELVPLVGGSGGAGGSTVGFSPFGIDPTPADGGGGGGAVQITAVGRVVLGAHAGISAGGGGGGECTSASGAGGGAGGAILLESPIVTVAAGCVLAANGGGGGGAD
jgi:hypothetical protein